jgi:hypothetical protein
VLQPATEARIHRERVVDGFSEAIRHLLHDLRPFVSKRKESNETSTRWPASSMVVTEAKGRRLIASCTRFGLSEVRNISAEYVGSDGQEVSNAAEDEVYGQRMAGAVQRLRGLRRAVGVAVHSLSYGGSASAWGERHNTDRFLVPTTRDSDTWIRALRI